MTSTGIEYLDAYFAELAHQRQHDPFTNRRAGFFDHGPEQPSRWCLGCARDGGDNGMRGHELLRRYAWAVPHARALDTIARWSPAGVVEVGAGGGYWAYELQRRGVDVVAYDPAPPGGAEESTWHAGHAWTAVHLGDHTAAAEHPDRTLLMVWPSYDEPWGRQAVEAYRGDTVIYVGEGPGGCTGDGGLHALLGDSGTCWHHDGSYNEQPCPDDCPGNAAPLFGEVESVAIPQWWGIHDRLEVYRRKEEARQDDEA